MSKRGWDNRAGRIDLSIRAISGVTIENEEKGVFLMNLSYRVSFEKELYAGTHGFSVCLYMVRVSKVNFVT